MSNPLLHYRSLLEQFLNGWISVDEFQARYLERFKNEGHLDGRLFDLLDELYGDVDSFTTDWELLAESPDFYLDEAALREKVRNAVIRLSAFDA